MLSIRGDTYISNISNFHTYTIYGFVRQYLIMTAIPTSCTFPNYQYHNKNDEIVSHLRSRTYDNEDSNQHS